MGKNDFPNKNAIITLLLTSEMIPYLDVNFWERGIVMALIPPYPEEIWQSSIYHSLIKFGRQQFHSANPYFAFWLQKIML